MRILKMKRFVSCAFTYAPFGLLAVVAGCGGGGSSQPTTTRSAPLGIYVTDSFRDDYSQVFVTLRKIEVSDGKQFRTVFEDAGGKSINASALANASTLVSRASVPEGHYTQVRVTLDDHINLVPAGGGAAINAPIDDSVGSHVGSQFTLIVDAPATVTTGTASKLILDIDLAAFELVGGRVHPHLRGGDDSKFQRDEKGAEVRGTVSNLTAQGFDLVLTGGSTVPVQITSATSVFSGKQGSAVALANGQQVEVKGSADPTTNTVTADRIKVEDGTAQSGSDNSGGNGEQQTGDNAQSEGIVASANSGAASFTLTLQEVEHLQPTAGTITVLTNASTVFHRHKQDAPASFADITSGVQVESFGVFDAATQTLTAQRVEIR
jgi:hypothetical protein